MKLFALCILLTVALVYASDNKKSEKDKIEANKQKIQDYRKTNGNKAEKEKMKGSESIYHGLPMPFVHYPFPFVNSYTPRYFPYGYTGLGHGDYGYGLGYGYGYNNYLV